MTPELRAYVARVRAEQGLPPTVEDPAILERVASVFRLVDPPVPAAGRRRGSTVKAVAS